VQTNRSVRQLVDWIDDCRADAGVVAMSPPRKALHFEPLFTDTYRFVCTRAMRDRLTPSGRSLSADQLHDVPLVMSPDVLAAPNETLEAHLVRLGLRLEPKHLVGSLESVAALSAAGLGVGLLPLKIGRLLQGDKLVELRVKLPGITDLGRLGIYFCCRSDKWRQDALAQELFACVQTTCKDLG
jgi:DNA-binding transcriptional LysR family regulator